MITTSSVSMALCVNCGFIGARNYINSDGPYCGACAEKHSPTRYFQLPPDAALLARAEKAEAECASLRAERDALKEAIEKIGNLSGVGDRHIDDYGEIARAALASASRAKEEKK